MRFGPKATTSAGHPVPAGADAYEQLGLDETASESDVRTAWSARVTALDPSKDGQALAQLNSAAETLLDPRRRAAIDRERAAAAAASAPAVAMEGSEDAAPRRQWLGTAASLVALVVLSVAATVAVVLAVLFRQQAEDATALQDAWEVAPATAAQAAEAVLGYDYQALDADAQAARRWLTPAYQREYDAQLQSLRAPAVEREIVVDAQVYAAGVLSATADQASVLLFVDQTRSVAGAEELPVANRVRFDLVLRDGQWLVDDIVTLDEL